MRKVAGVAFAGAHTVLKSAVSSSNAERGMKLWILAAAGLLVISACAGIPNEEAFKAKVSSWQGRNVGDLVKEWGQPNSTLHTPGGGMVYT
ncbi:MAG: hypothetical protein WCA01_13755, partial [Burkholderiales bacterium]